MAKGMIVAIRDVPGDARRPRELTHKEVSFTIDDTGPFSLLVPLEEYTPQKATAMVQAKVHEWAEVVGKPITS